MTFTRYFTQAPRAFPALGGFPADHVTGSRSQMRMVATLTVPVDEVTFVLSGGDGAVLAELVYGPFDRVPLLVSFAVERGRAAPLATLRSRALT